MPTAGPYGISGVYDDTKSVWILPREEAMKIGTVRRVVRLSGNVGIVPVCFCVCCHFVPLFTNVYK